MTNQVSPDKLAYIYTLVDAADSSTHQLAMAAPGEESLFLEDGNAKVEKSPKKGFVKFFVDNWFMITTIIGVIIGFGVGFALQKLDLNEAQKIWLAMPGNIYIRLLQLTILPMIASNIIVVLANLNPKENGKVSAISLGFILLFNLLSALIGIMYGYIIRPVTVVDVAVSVL
ncbi:unnamed protein product [Hymenolepis diminuta]|uniref:Amino acid transporter n=1 Tax=Hymenolepis diminuta TaxID=6216 RepID=A0A0R3SNC6_HYMDI|nr:unnamed protein product [Hymenolepis diminuta]